MFPDHGHGPYRLLRAFSGRARVAFEQGCADPAGSQRARLARILGAMDGTAFARDHGLRADMDVDALRAAVPVRTHAELAPYLDRVAAGEPRVLTRAPVRMLLETSGTTGRPKWLPVTDAWARSGCSGTTRGSRRGAPSAS